MWLYLMSCDCIWCHVTVFDVMWLSLMSCDCLWCHVTVFDVMWLYLMSCDCIWCHVTVVDDVMWHVGGGYSVETWRVRTHHRNNTRLITLLLKTYTSSRETRLSYEMGECLWGFHWKHSCGGSTGKCGGSTGSLFVGVNCVCGGQLSVAVGGLNSLCSCAVFRIIPSVVKTQHGDSASNLNSVRMLFEFISKPLSSLSLVFVHHSLQPGTHAAPFVCYNVVHTNTFCML